MSSLCSVESAIIGLPMWQPHFPKCPRCLTNKYVDAGFVGTTGPTDAPLFPGNDIWFCDDEETGGCGLIFRLDPECAAFKK